MLKHLALTSLNACPAYYISESMKKVRMFSSATDKDIKSTAEKCVRSAEDRSGGKRDWRKRKIAWKYSNGNERQWLVFK